MRCEAYFIVSELILARDEGGGSPWEKICCKYPDPVERFKFYRMSVGYALKAYCAHRRLSTIGYLRNKGIIENHVQLEDDYVPRDDHQALMNLMVEEAARTPMEKKVLAFYCMGDTIEVIAEKVELEPKRVKKVMRRIKRRLRQNEKGTE